MLNDGSGVSCCNSACSPLRDSGSDAELLVCIWTGYCAAGCSFRKPGSPRGICGMACCIDRRIYSEHRVLSLSTLKKPDVVLVSSVSTGFVLVIVDGSAVDGGVCAVWHECDLPGIFRNIHWLGSLPDLHDYDCDVVGSSDGRMEARSKAGDAALRSWTDMFDWRDNTAGAWQSLVIYLRFPATRADWCYGPYCLKQMITNLIDLVVSNAIEEGKREGAVCF